MQSLQTNFDELRQRLRQGRRLSNAGDDPVFYVIFHPSQMIEAKQGIKSWKAKLKLEGWTLVEFSMADAVQEILMQHPLREIWLEQEAADPMAWDDVNKTFSDVLTAKDALKRKLDEKLQELAESKQTVLFVTDLEALHPYLRVGSLEQELQGRFTIPTVVMYPGIRTGKSTLSFLGIYPEDGNYRSEHIGG